MYKFNRIMVGLDFSETDQTILTYTRFLTGMLNPTKVYFIHIHRNLDMPEGLRKKFPELNQPVDERLKEQMKAKVESVFKGQFGFTHEYVVIEGSPLKEMLKWSHIKNIDLLIVGRKKESEGSGLLPQQLARKVLSSVLFVPANAKKQLKKILVPIDFSENSQMALEEAINLASEQPATAITCYHIFSLPSGFYSTGKTEKEFSAIMKENALAKYNKVITKLKAKTLSIKPVIEMEKASKSQMINSKAHAVKSDIIIIGARGGTNTSVLLLGSVTEKLIKADFDIPVLVIKQKDKSFSFWDLIREI